MKNVIDQYFDAGWKAYVTDSRKKAAISNARMFRILTQIKGYGFVGQLQFYLKSLKSTHATIKLARKPTGIQVANRRYLEFPEIWVKNGECELGTYADVSIQIRPDRWIMFTVWLSVK